MPTHITKDDFRSIDEVLHEMFGSSRTNKGSTSYPFTDIAVDEKTGLLFVGVAIAGFKKEDINISAESNYISIKGKRTSDINEELTIIQKTIAGRDFERKIVLNPKYIGGPVEASIEDGILLLTIKPSETYSKSIEIK